ncbi:MAG: sensor histidine kinase [Desulfobacterium sp.]|nr:sensor histidine kinase [Desulfobacterium sp.]
MAKFSLGIRDKLIGIFILIKVLPLIVLAWFAWSQVFELASSVRQRITEMTQESRDVVGLVGSLASKDSIRALDIKSRESIERLTTDTAKAVASFLYDRDRDIQYAASIQPTASEYHRFITSRFRAVTNHQPWIFDRIQDKWVPATEFDTKQTEITADNKDNRRDFHYRHPQPESEKKDLPIYLEMTFIDVNGREKIKVTTSDMMPSAFRDVSRPENTFCKAETYFKELKKLKTGEIYVSDVIGAYVHGYVIGDYTKANTQKMGIPFEPEKSGYAGKENPVGKKFQGIIRWATPVMQQNTIIGFVTLALDHTHVMEFTDYIIPTEERYLTISDASNGNYAFMWDHKDRNISHPRDYFIVGYDPETGKPSPPWMDQELYKSWQDSRLPIWQFLETAPQFHHQTLEKKPSEQLARSGSVGLDGRFLNFAPQCSGWHNITQNGGSGSFLIFWSGLWKLTTAAAIPYHTGQYGEHPRGFGYVTIGANVHEFHRPAMETSKNILAIEKNYIASIEQKDTRNQDLMQHSLQNTAQELTYYTLIMITIVIIIAIWMASTLTRRITNLIQGIERFQNGDMEHRLEKKSNDEMGKLSLAFNNMANSIQQFIMDIHSEKDTSEKTNILLKEEIKERQKAEHALAVHRDNLETMIQKRTAALEKEILEHQASEKAKEELEHRLHRAEKMEAIGTLAGGVAHDLNNILSGIVSYPELLLMQLSADSPFRKSIKTILEAGNRAAAIVQDLLTLARRGVTVAEVVNLNTIIKEYLSSPEHEKLLSFHPRIHIKTNLENGLLNISGSSHHLSKTIMNLVSNAAEAMPKGGIISILTENRYVDQPLRGYDHVEEGDYATISITDSGIGISSEDMERIFEPFYTKKKMGRSGTGLGMAVVWGTIKDHQGYIDCQSIENKGTVFTLYFPVTREEVSGEIPKISIDDFMGNGETILVVDDIKEQREIATLILTKLNYKVTTVSSGEKAIQYMNRNSADLLILDMIMEPGIDGLDTLEKILEIHPGQKAIITSGYSETDRVREAQKLGAEQYIKKPYSIDKFGIAVKKEIQGLKKV